MKPSQEPIVAVVAAAVTAVDVAAAAVVVVTVVVAAVIAITIVTSASPAGNKSRPRIFPLSVALFSGVRFNFQRQLLCSSHNPDHILFACFHFA